GLVQPFRQGLERGRIVAAATAVIRERPRRAVDVAGLLVRLRLDQIRTALVDEIRKERDRALRGREGLLPVARVGVTVRVALRAAPRVEVRDDLAELLLEIVRERVVERLGADAERARDRGRRLRAFGEELEHRA